MFLSAVSIAAILAFGPDQAPKLSKAESDVWRTVRSSVVVLQSGGQDRGVAICIDPSGWFVAHKNIVGFPLLFGRLKSGQIVQLMVKANDATTELSLLRAEVGAYSGLTSVRVAEEPSAGDIQTAFAVVPGGSIKTEIVSVDKLGIMQPTRRAVPLLELRFEAPLTRVGGSPVFTQKGELLGLLTATVPTDESERILNQQSNAKSQAACGADSTGFGGAAKIAPPLQYGPTGLTVGYAIGPAALTRVVEGFRSPERQVVFPAIGIVIADAKPIGAEVRQIAEGSAASDAGLQVGDVIIEIGGQRVRNQVDYAKFMMRRRVGQPLEVKVLRGADSLTISVTPRS